MINDGGLRDVLETADLVVSDLSALNRTRSHNNGKRQRRGRMEEGVLDDPHQANSSLKSNISESNDLSPKAGVRRKPSRSLSDVSTTSSTTHLNKLNLSKHTSAELKQVVTPLIKKLEKLDAAALLSLNPSNSKTGATLDAQRNLTVPPIHDRITPTYEGVDNKGNPMHIVRYLHVHEVPSRYSVGIFVFPPNAEIPLHDHPNMVVLSRVLYGELRVRSYDLLPKVDPSTSSLIEQQRRSDQDDETRSYRDENDSRDHFAKAKSSPSKQSALRSSLSLLKNLVSRAINPYYSEDEAMSDESCSGGNYVLRAMENLNPMGVVQLQSSSSRGEGDAPAILSAPHVTCLFPYEGNCHAFVAGPHGAAVMDVLIPPYDTEEGRDCTFYKASEDHGGASVFHRDVVCPPPNFPSDKNEDGKGARSYYLTPIDQPDNFHCLSGVYGRFGACKNYCDPDLVDFPNEEESRGIDFSACNLS